MHTINLNRVWERHILQDESFAWVRWFQKPSNISSGEQVYLVAEPLLLKQMWLNKNPLRDLVHEGHRVCISESLCQRNSLAFCQAGPTVVSNVEWITDVTSGRFPSERIDLPINFGKVVLKID
ncbi:MAG: hypothetical protein CMJ66_00630 [Planctomycetaceae bacterium]|jgi:hypothetical protein|nr:hypothetical protein [Planctomycetaceae bacterium]